MSLKSHPFALLSFGLVIIVAVSSVYIYTLNQQISSVKEEVDTLSRQIIELEEIIQDMNSSIPPAPPFDKKPWSLEDVTKHPENYLGRWSGIPLTIVNVKRGPYWGRWENYTIYVVVVRDAYGYQVSFMVPEGHGQDYERCLGGVCPFTLSVQLGPEMVVVGPHCNLIAEKKHPQGLGYYRVYIKLE